MPIKFSLHGSGLGTGVKPCGWFSFRSLWAGSLEGGPCFWRYHVQLPDAARHCQTLPGIILTGRVGFELASIYHSITIAQLSEMTVRLYIQLPAVLCVYVCVCVCAHVKSFIYIAVTEGAHSIV